MQDIAFLALGLGALAPAPPTPSASLAFKGCEMTEQLLALAEAGALLLYLFYALIHPEKF